MAKESDAKIRAELRDSMIAELTEFLSQNYDTVLRVKGNKIAIATVDKNRDDRWVELTIAVPTGARDDDAGYDAEGMAEEYQIRQKELDDKKKQKQKEADAKKRQDKKKKDKDQGEEL